MSTPARIVLILLAVLVLGAGALAAFVLTLDPERYRPQIVELVKSETGLDVRLDGPITWSIWPSITLGISDAAADWTDARATPLIAAERVSLSVALMPLLSSTPRLEIGTVTIAGVTLDLRVDADGRGNWQSPDSREEDQRPDDGPADPVDVDTDAGSDIELGLERLEVTNLTIRYVDAVSGTDARLEGLNLIATSPTPDAMSIVLGGRASVADGPTINFDGRLVTALDGSRVDIDALGADITLPDIAAPIRTTLSGRIVNDKAADAVRFEQLDLRIADVAASLSGSIRDLSGKGALELDLRIAPSDLRALLGRFDAVPATTDPAALTRFSGQIGITGAFDDVRVQPLTLAIDALKITGSAAYRSGARPHIRFDLAGGLLDLAPYMPPETATAAPATGPLVDDAPLGLEALKDFDLEGELRADGIKVAGLDLGPSSIKLDNRSGRLQARVLTRGFLGGNVDLAITADASGAKPTIDMRLDASGIEAGSLAPDLGFSGPVGLRGSLEGSGESSAALSRTLTGRLDLSGTPGTVDVASLRAGLLTIAQLLGKGEKIAAWPDRIGYQKLAGAWVVQNGLGNQQLRLDVDNMKVDALGGMALDTGAFDFRAGSTFTATTPRSFDVPKDLDGIRLPMRCAGKLADTGNPCGFDQDAAGPLIAQVLASKAGSEAAAQLQEKLQDKLPENLRGPAQQLLRGIFGTPAPKPQPEAEPQSPPNNR